MLALNGNFLVSCQRSFSLFQLNRDDELKIGLRVLIRNIQVLGKVESFSLGDYSIFSDHEDLEERQVSFLSAGSSSN